MFLQLLFCLVVYAYMNGAIFRLFGVVILIFNLLISVVFVLLMRSDPWTRLQAVEGSLVFFGFLLLSTLIAVGLIRLHRWAAVTASAIGLIWAFTLASALGHRSDFVRDLLLGLPVVTGMLLPLYATVKNWSSLKALENLEPWSTSRALRSLDRFHLE